MRNLVLMFSATIALAACNSRKAPQNLPKDIALKPDHEQQIDKERENLKDLKSQIDSISTSVACNNPDDWRISPLGAKPCGGPSSYIAYPKSLEDEILPKIQNYTKEQSDFNRKNQLLSDCAIVPIPTGIKCENGKAVLIRKPI